MKILCVCEGGNVRSVGMAFALKHIYGQDALACGWRFNSLETFKMLCDWADRIVVMQEVFVAKVPSDVLRSKVRVVDVGPDCFGNPLHPDLQACVQHAAEAWMKKGWNLGHDVYTYNATGTELEIKETTA